MMNFLLGGLALIFSLGMSVLVRTEITGTLPPSTLTVEVTVRVGAVTSFLP